MDQVDLLASGVDFKVGIERSETCQNLRTVSLEGVGGREYLSRAEYLGTSVHFLCFFFNKLKEFLPV